MWLEKNIGEVIMSEARLVRRSVSLPLIPLTDVRKYENTHVHKKSAGNFKE